MKVHAIVVAYTIQLGEPLTNLGEPQGGLGEPLRKLGELLCELKANRWPN